MNCWMFTESLEALVDGEIADGAERADLEAHAAKCESCRKEMTVARKARAAMQAFGAPKAPAGFANRVSSEARPEPVSIFARPRWRVAAAVVLVAAGAGLGIYMLLSAGSVSSGSQDPVAQEAPAPSEENTPRQPIVVPAETAKAPVLAQAPQSPQATTPVAAQPAEDSDEEVAENLDVLENWELINDPDVAVALALPDEDFELLMSAMEEGM